MGLRPRRALLAVVLVLAGAACTSDESGDAAPRTGEGSATDPPTTGASTGDETGDLLGGSRYLALNDHDDEGLNRIVRRDLVAGTEEVVRDPTSRTFTAITVDAAGAVAWAEWDDGQDPAVFVRSADGPLVEVDDDRAGCPRWLPDGRLLVTLGDEDPELAAVAPDTGAVDEVFAVDLGAMPVCPAPAGQDQVIFPRAIGEPYGPEGSQVVRSGVDGSDQEVVGTVPGGCWPLDVAASVDGEQVAAGVICEDARLTGLYLGSMADDLHLAFGRNEDPDPTHAEVEVHPAWSGDGTLVAFDRGDQTGDRTRPTLWTVTSPGGDASELEPSPSAIPALSPPPQGGGRD